MDNSLDYGGNFSHMLGFDDPKMLELMRLYVTIHRFSRPPKSEWTTSSCTTSSCTCEVAISFDSLFSTFLFLCSDHEGGNVSAHTGHLVRF